MTRRFIGVRWWLGAAFAVVAATSTAIVVSQFSTRSENVFRGHAEQLVLADARLAARATPSSLSRLARQMNVQLRIEAVPTDGEHVTGTADGRTFVATVPYRGETLVATSSRPDVAEAIGTVNGEALRAGIIAGVVGVVVGLLLAQLIALRLRRLSIAAESLAHGDFETPLRYRFRDEFGALTDNFERMRRQLRRSFRHIEGERDRLRMLLERLHEGVVTVDQHLAVHFANNEARRLLGVRLAAGDQLPEPWEGFSLREFVQHLFDPDASLAQAHVRPGEERALGLVGIPAQPEGDTVLIVLDDLTEQERRELAEREFVSNAAHELRTPLTTIIGAIEVLQAGAKENPDERDRFLTHIEREAARLARLAHALLALARAHAGQERVRLEPTVLEPILREVANDLRPRDGVVVEVECTPGLAANVNRDLLEQALRNLGENAAKHTPQGRVVLRAYAAGSAVRVEVEDTGVGMSSDAQGHVFDRFYRGADRDPEGFGLGLAIVRQAIRSLDGRIELDSAPGEGTRVRIVLERAQVREQVPA
ncbi:MAG TPA: ATP-binding protein [Gaiellaceae bacterium]|nr:ATP-binding protein [Gaiellaceae bacterium]